MTALAPHLARFLREHLPRERNASPHTVAAYAHSFTLLVRFAADRLKRRPSDLAVEDIDPKLVLEFLDHVEEGRGNRGVGKSWGSCGSCKFEFLSEEAACDRNHRNENICGIRWDRWRFGAT